MRITTLFKPIVLAVALGGLSMAASTSLLAAARLANGQWESAMTTAGETHSVKFCIDADEANSINGDSQTGRAYAEKKAKKTGGRCMVTSFDIKDDTVAYSLSCGDRSIQSVQTYHGDTSEGRMTTLVQGQAAVTTQIKSRRLGTCP